jgi:hypothetical protein
MLHPDFVRRAGADRASEGVADRPSLAWFQCIGAVPVMLMT